MAVSEKYSAILLCGGEGTRLRALTRDLIPKPLYRVGERELIRHTIDILDRRLVGELIFAVRHQADSVVNWALTANLDFKISFSGRVLNGVIPAIKDSSELAEGSGVIVCCTDELRLNFDIKNMVAHHEESGMAATVLMGYHNGPGGNAFWSYAGLCIMRKDVVWELEAGSTSLYCELNARLSESGRLNFYRSWDLTHVNVNTPDDAELAEKLYQLSKSKRDTSR